MIRCRAARRLIDAAPERELALERRLELESHLATCQACTRRAHEARTLQEWLEGPGDPAPNPPDVDAAARAVFARLEQDQQQSQQQNQQRGPQQREEQPLQRRRVRRVALVVTLALAAGILLVLLLRQGAVSTGVESETSLAADEEGRAESEGIETLVRAALLESFGGRGLDLERAHGRYLEAVREPLRSGWPVRRFVEQELASPEPTLALAAVRCLGAGGDGSAALALERALARPELAEEVLEALGGLALVPASAEPAVAVLERALQHPEQAPAALRELCRVGGERVAACIERAARAARDGDAPSREALLDALTTTGSAAVASLLRLAQAERSEAECDAILARLPLVSGGGPELARLLGEESVPSDLAYPALAALQPAEAVPWLEARALQARERGPALAVLADFGGPEPLAAALRLAEARRVPRADVRALMVRLFAADEERAEPFSRALAEVSEPARLHAWLALLIESEDPAAAAALVPLVFAPALPGEDREWAALAVGELGGEHEARALALSLALALGEGLDGDWRLAAACLLSIHAHLGFAEVESLLARASASDLRRVSAALAGDGRSGGAVRVHRVARALEDALARPGADTEAVKEIL